MSIEVSSERRVLRRKSSSLSLWLRPRARRALRLMRSSLSAPMRSIVMIRSTFISPCAEARSYFLSCSAESQMAIFEREWETM